jgi:hypothetical protein
MSTEPNVILATKAAREKDCTAQAVYNALDRGDLNEVQMGRHRFVVKDEKYEEYTVQETGGRAHSSYRSNSPRS